MGGISGPRGAIRCVVMRYTARHAGAEIFAHLVFVGVAVGGANFEHMTWLSILFFGVVCMTYAIGYFKWFFWAYMTFQITVILGVLVMSLSDCLVFEDAYNDNGPTRYIAGNTGMHYLESVVVYALADRPTIQCGFDTAFVQIMLAFSISMVWYYFEDPTQTYECSIPKLLGVTGVFASTLLTTAVAITVQLPVELDRRAVDTIVEVPPKKETVVVPPRYSWVK